MAGSRTNSRRAPAPESICRKRRRVTHDSDNEAGKPTTRAQTVIEGLHRLYSEGKHTDLTITCGERRWQVHKALLCAQSEYFYKGCSGVLQEAQSNTISLHNDDPAMVNILIEHFYDKIPDDVATGNVLSRTDFYVGVHAIADKYCIDPLKKWAFGKIEECVAGEDDPVSALHLAQKVYSAEPSIDLRAEIIGKVRTHAKNFYSKEETPEALEMQTTFKSIMEQTPELAVDLAVDSIKRKVESDQATRSLWCEMCFECFSVEETECTRYVAHTDCGTCMPIDEWDRRERG